MKKVNLKLILSKTKTEEKIDDRIPKRKSSKGCYIDPHELGLLVVAYIESCSIAKLPCIRKCDKGRECRGTICPNRIVKCEGKLAEVIWRMSKEISKLYEFRKVPEIVEDLPTIGYISAVSKLRNMHKKDPDSAFSFITTVIKNSYKAYKKDHNEHNIMKMVIEMEFKHLDESSD